MSSNAIIYLLKRLKLAFNDDFFCLCFVISTTTFVAYLSYPRIGDFWMRVIELLFLKKRE